MSAHTIGLISGGLVIISIIPYAARVYQRKIHPVPTTWALWSLIGLTLLLAFRSSGAKENVWPAIFGFVNPTIVTILTAWRKNKWEPLTRVERTCVVLCAVSLFAWWFVRDNEALALYTLILAIIADLCAAVPTFIFFRDNPDEDRPFAWFIFAIGYFVAVFAVTNHNPANYILPLYMTAGSGFATVLLVVPRIKRGIPLKEWV